MKVNIFSFSMWYVVVMIFFAAILFTGLGSEYPLNDDWMYASGVQSLVEEGRYAMKGEFSPNIFLQILSGWFVCLMTGAFSFVFLRVSTLIWAFVGLYALYKTVHVITASDTKAMFASLILLANPLYFNLSFTFMSDIPFIALVLMSIWQYVLFFERKKKTHRYRGALLSVMAFLVRQPGILLFFSFEVVYRWNNSNNRRRFLFGFLLISGIIAVLYLAVEMILKPYLTGEQRYINVLAEVPFSNPVHLILMLLQRLLMSIYYLGFLLIVFLPAVVKMFLQDSLYTRIWFWLILLLNAVVMIYLALVGRYFPYSGNVIYNFGLGAPLLADYDYLPTGNYPQLPVWLIMLAGYLIQVYSFFLIYYISKKIFSDKRKNDFYPVWMLLLFIVLYSLFMFSFSFFDRYVLPMAALMTITIAYAYPEWLKPSIDVWIVWLLLFAFSILGTKDYLNWNNAVLKEKERLVISGVDRKDIFAGLSQNSWDTQSGKMSDQKYIFSWGKKDGYIIYKKIKFNRHLYGKGILLLLKKKE